MNCIPFRVTTNTSFGPEATRDSLSPSPTDNDWQLVEMYVSSTVNDLRFGTRVQGGTHVLLVVLYLVMIVFGAVGNLMVIAVVAKSKAMRTARNVFIVNLAVSDLMLCLITMPLTLVEILYNSWQVACIFFTTLFFAIYDKCFWDACFSKLEGR